MVIKNIIFDLGGVLLNINPSLTINAFKERGIVDLDKIYSQCNEDELFIQFETGKIAEQEFRNKLKHYFLLHISNQDINTAWNAMLLDLPLEKVEILNFLHQKYRLFLLSNTNSIHLKGVKNIIKKQYGNDIFSQLFEKEYYSHLIGIRKPDKKVFELILNENLLKANEILFIDDTQEHVECAKKMGLQTFWMSEDKKLSDIFLFLGINTLA